MCAPTGFEPQFLGSKVSSLVTVSTFLSKFLLCAHLLVLVLVKAFVTNNSVMKEITKMQDKDELCSHITKVCCTQSFVDFMM